MSPVPPTEGRSWIEVARLDDLPPGSGLEFAHGGRVYALFRVGDEVACLDGLCPHQGGRLGLGPLGGSRVTCPRRGCLRWSFDIRTGAGTVGESVRRAVHPVRVEGRQVLVSLPGP